MSIRTEFFKQAYYAALQNRKAHPFSISDVPICESIFYLLQAPPVTVYQPLFFNVSSTILMTAYILLAFLHFVIGSESHSQLYKFYHTFLLLSYSKRKRRIFLCLKILINSLRMSGADQAALHALHVTAETTDGIAAMTEETAEMTAGTAETTEETAGMTAGIAGTTEETVIDI